MRDDLVAVGGQRVGAGHRVGLGLDRFTVEAQLGDWAAGTTGSEPNRWGCLVSLRSGRGYSR
jgi:hypothetical protein